MTPNDTVPIPQVLTKQDKELVMRVEGRVAWVNDPMKQSAKDVEFQRHKQNVRIEDKDGTSLTIQIQKANMHFAQEAKGKWYVFESQKSDGHGWKGLTIDRWTRTKGEHAGQETVTLVASGMANVFSPEGQSSSSPPANQQPASQPQQSATTAAPPAQSQPQTGSGAGGTGGMSLADARAQAERRIMEEPKNVEDITGEWLHIYQVVRPLAEAAGVPEAQIGALTTHVRLSFPRGQRAVFKAEQQQRPQAQSGAAPATQPRTWRDQPCGAGKKLGQLTREEFVGLLIRSVPYSGDNQTGLAIKAAAIEGMADMKVTFEQVYDTLASVLYGDHGRNAVDDAYDELKTLMNLQDDEAFCRVILEDQTQFVETVLLKKEPEPVAGQAPQDDPPGGDEIVGAAPMDDDDIPF